MNRIAKFQIVVLCCLLFFVSACQQVAITGRKQFNLVPNAIMNTMSFQSYSEFLTQNKLSSNARQVGMVKDVGLRVQKAVEKYCSENDLSSRLKGYDWEFNLVEDPTVNAWCMPGGKVVVNTGLMPIAKNETGLAVVMGHEIAHAIARHGAERMTQGLIVELGGVGLSKALTKYPDQTKNLFMKSYSVGTQYGVLLPYSRVHETEADRLGLIFIAMAGYDPRQAVGFWERMAAANEGDAPPDFLSTHPSDATRIRKIKTFMPEAMQYYHQG